MRVLVMAHSGTNSRDILLDVEAGFRQAGHEVIRWEFEPMQRLMARVGEGQGRAVLTADLGSIVKSLCEANRIDFTLAMWANGLMAFGVSPQPGMTAPTSYFEKQRLRHVLTTIRRGLDGKASDGQYLLGSFSYADIAVAQVLFLVAPKNLGGFRLSADGLRGYTDVALSEEFKDVVQWRDDLYAKHRGPAAQEKAA